VSNHLLLYKLLLLLLLLLSKQKKQTNKQKQKWGIPLFLIVCLYSIMAQLYNGDCLEVLKTLADSSIDLVITDLPYGQTACDWDIAIDMTKLWAQLLRVGKDNTAYVFFCSTKFGYSLIESNKKMFRYDLVWQKPDCRAGFLNARKMPLRNHEMIYIFYKKLPTYNIEDNHVKIQESLFNKKPGDSVYLNKNGSNTSGKIYEPGLPGSVISCVVNRSKKQRKHPTEKPQGILEWLIKYYSKRGGVVLDPTMGSGSTGVACKTLSRSFIGIEMNKEYYDVASAQISPPVVPEEIASASIV
jgi:DNA modification methylase